MIAPTTYLPCFICYLLHKIIHLSLKYKSAVTWLRLILNNSLLVCGIIERAESPQAKDLIYNHRMLVNNAFTVQGIHIARYRNTYISIANTPLMALYITQYYCSWDLMTLLNNVLWHTGVMFPQHLLNNVNIYGMYEWSMVKICLHWMEDKIITTTYSCIVIILACIAEERLKRESVLSTCKTWWRTRLGWRSSSYTYSWV